MKISLLHFVILIFFQKDAIGFKCICSGHYGATCTDTCDAGSYCITTWIVANGAIRDQDCLTTRTDLSDRQCQTNRKGLVSCVCNKEKCNDASFGIPTDMALTAPSTIKCFNRDLNEENFCFGHFCTYTIQMTMNDFGDVFPSRYLPNRGCGDSEYNHDISSMNMCSMNNGAIVCQCNTEFCNRDQPYQVPIGNLLCYVSAYDSTRYTSSLKYCRGHLCYIVSYYDEIRERGCLSVSDGAPEETKKPGYYGDWKFCNEDLCNGDYTADAAVIETSVSNLNSSGIGG